MRCVVPSHRVRIPTTLRRFFLQNGLLLFFLLAFLYRVAFFILLFDSLSPLHTFLLLSQLRGSPSMSFHDFGAPIRVPAGVFLCPVISAVLFFSKGHISSLFVSAFALASMNAFLLFRTLNKGPLLIGTLSFLFYCSVLSSPQDPFCPFLIVF